jgi:hypothetical protein
MTGFDFEMLARQARDEVQPGDPPMAAITSQPRHRLRGSAIVLAAAAAVALVIGLVVVWPSSSPHSGTPPEPAQTLPAAPGMRWVGAGNVVLAVPSDWADSQYGCETDARPSVVYDVGYWQTCQDTALGRARHPSALWILPTEHARSGYGGEAFVKAVRPVPALHALRSEPWREGGDAGRYWYQSLVVPAAHTMFVAQSRTRAAAVAMIASARHLPVGVRVPPVQAGEDVVSARRDLDPYDIRVRTDAGDYRSGSVIDSDPAFGTPVQGGGTIVLTVSTGLGHQPAMSDAFLAQHDVHVEPLGSISAAERARIERARDTIASRLAVHPSPWDTQLVWRRITTDEPSRHGVPEFRHRLAWLALTPRELVEPLGGPCCGHTSLAAGLARDISIYDALTGQFVWGESF